MVPKLRFSINCQQEVITFFNFVKDSHYNNGRFLQWAILNGHPYFKKFFRKNKLIVNRKLVNEYVNNFYKQHGLIIKQKLMGHKKAWQKIESTFFKLTANLFKNISWPKGKYIAYPTIWGMYPRYLHNKTFQIPYRHKRKNFTNVVIAHEMLHFIFYYYFYKKYPKYKKEKYNFFVWNISEIFNSLILNSKSWQKLLPTKNIDYPEHKTVIAKIKKQYKESMMIDQIIGLIIKNWK